MTADANAAHLADPSPADPSPDARVAIRVEGVGVKYSLRFTRKTTLHRSFVNLFVRQPADEFWALRDVSFNLVHGESLAVIGPNGAGKSTLLQVLAGIILPSEGSVEVDGLISSLLTLGAGFDQELTGRENIRLAGAFLGIQGREMEERTPGIIDFAELGPFIDAPIRTYSSGMRARLGFSIATSVDPDILLLDEVLATGDEVFRAKSKARVLDLVRQAKGVVLVTHDMNWVVEFCNRAILLQNGRIVAEGDPAEVVATHKDHSRKARAEREAAIARALDTAGGATLPPDAAGSRLSVAKPRRITRSPDPLRVLTIARWYPSHDSPGHGSFVADLVRAVGAAGVEGRVISFDRVLVRGRVEERDAVLAEARAAYEAVALPAALFVTPSSHGSLLSPGVPVARLAVVRRPGSSDAAALVEDHLAALLPFLERLIDEWRPDVIHAHTGLPDGVVATAAGRQLGIPVVVTEHASTIERDLADPAARTQYQRLLEPGVGLFAVSPSLAVRLAAILEVSVTRIGVLPIPIADGSFPLADPGLRDGNELLWVGSLGPHKGVDVLLHAFGKLLEIRPELLLRIVGVERTAGDLENLEELATAIAVRSATSFDGWLARDQVAAAMARAAVFVHASPSETFGVAAGEAILTGLPVAARRSGGVPWIVELSGGFGQIADGGEAEALAAAIEQVLAGDLPVDRATARQRLVEALGSEAVARQTIAIYRQSIAAARGKKPVGDAASSDGDVPAPGPGGPAPTPGQANATPTTVAAALPAILVASGRDHALPLVAALPADLLARLTLVIPAWREGATEPLNTVWPIRLIEAAPVQPRKPRPTGRGLLAGLRRATDRPAPTAEEALASAILAAAAQIRGKAGINPPGAPVEMVALDAPAAAIMARLGGKGVRLAPGALRWLADRWDAGSRGA